MRKLCVRAFSCCCSCCCCACCGAPATLGSDTESEVESSGRELRGGKSALALTALTTEDETSGVLLVSASASSVGTAGRPAGDNSNTAASGPILAGTTTPHAAGACQGSAEADVDAAFNPLYERGRHCETVCANSPTASTHAGTTHAAETPWHAGEGVPGETVPAALHSSSQSQQQQQVAALQVGYTCMLRAQDPIGACPGLAFFQAASTCRIGWWVIWSEWGSGARRFVRLQVGNQGIHTE